MNRAIKITLFTFASVLIIIGGVLLLLHRQSETPELGNGFANDKVEKTIIDYLLTQEDFSWKTRADSVNFCVIENLGSKNDLFPLSIWVRCGEFIMKHGNLEEVSGMSGPAKINYPNELSYYGVGMFSHEDLGLGADYARNIAKVFSKEVQQKIHNFNQEAINQKIEAVALAWFNSRWDLIKENIEGCNVKSAGQTHAQMTLSFVIAYLLSRINLSLRQI